MRNRPLVLVEWYDTTTYSNWRSEKDLTEKPPLSISVGWKVRADRKFVTLSSMRCDGDCNVRQMIAKGCIQSIRRLKE